MVVGVASLLLVLRLGAWPLCASLVTIVRCAIAILAHIILKQRRFLLESRAWLFVVGYTMCRLVTFGLPWRPTHGGFRREASNL